MTSIVGAKTAIFRRKNLKNSKKIDFASKCFRVNYMIVDGLQSVLGHPEHVFKAL